MSTMKAAVIHEAGGPEVLRLRASPSPTPQAGEVLIRIKAFGLNRSELFTRQGHSPGVKFPRVLGIEAVGLVEAGTRKRVPQGRYRRDRNGRHGAAVRRRLRRIYMRASKAGATHQDRTRLGDAGCHPGDAADVMGLAVQVASLEKGERLLIRGGTTSVGLAAAAIAKNHGAFVAATTRKPERNKLLLASGADQVFIDTGSIAEQVREVCAGGVDKVLELVGTTTLKDSLRCAKQRGIVCMTGIVGNKWSFDDFAPMEAIPTAVSLTTYAGESEDFMRTPLEELVEQIVAGRLHVQVGKVFHLDEIVEAHRCMEENKAGGKIVVLT